MESNWRLNASLLGLEYPEICVPGFYAEQSLVAGLPPSPVQYATNWRLIANPSVMCHVELSGSGIIVAHYNGTVTPLHPHFPYGYTVDPD